MDITTSSRTSRPSDVARSDATTRSPQSYTRPRVGYTPRCTRRAPQLTGSRSAWGRQGRIAVNGLKNRRRRLLHACERLRERLAVAAIQMDVVA